MKILYVSVLPILNDSLGVLNKIEQQTKGLILLDVEIDVIIFFKDKSDLVEINKFPDYFKFHKYSYGGLKRPYQLLKLWYEISICVQKPENDLVYFRYPGASYFLFKLLQRNPVNIILEHNTKELDEFRLNSNNPLKIYFEKYFARKSFKYALGNVGKSSDFSEHQEDKVGYRLNLKTITNGVSVNEFQRVEKNKFNSEIDTITIIFVGNTAIWHGLERFIEGLSLYNNVINYKLLLVGRKERFIKIIDQYNLNYLINDKIYLTGFKTKNDLNILFSEAHFAIGSLGLHRINIIKGVPLKHREYMARGIPFIYAGQDEDIHSDIEPLLFNIEANEKPVDVYILLKFITELYMNNNDVQSSLIEYAHKHMDMKIKSNELLNYFKERIIYKNSYESK